LKSGEGSILRKFIVLAALAALAFSPAFEAEAASKKKASSRSDYTKEQQKKFHEQALKLCRKAYGTQLHFVRVNYKKLQYVCYHY
jgi:spermidine/putrescine-binding protein